MILAFPSRPHFAGSRYQEGRVPLESARRFSFPSARAAAAAATSRAPSKLKLAVSFFSQRYFLVFLSGILFSIPGMTGARLTKTRASSGLGLICSALLPLYRFSV